MEPYDIQCQDSMKSHEISIFIGNLNAEVGRRVMMKQLEDSDKELVKKKTKKNESDFSSRMPRFKPRFDFKNRQDLYRYGEETRINRLHNVQ